MNSWKSARKRFNNLTEKQAKHMKRYLPKIQMTAKRENAQLHLQWEKCNFKWTQIHFFQSIRLVRILKFDNLGKDMGNQIVIHCLWKDKLIQTLLGGTCQQLSKFCIYMHIYYTHTHTYRYTSIPVYLICLSNPAFENLSHIAASVQNDLCVKLFILAL